MLQNYIFEKFVIYIAIFIFQYEQFNKTVY